VTELYKQTRSILKIKKIIPYQFSGYKFSGLDDILNGVEHMGYYTDKNLEDEKNAKQFSQAQFILAPTILELNNLEHKYILFDCSHEEIAWDKIRQIRATPIRKNQFGIILAQSKQ